MSKQVEIRAELLKWCPYGFEFTFNGAGFILRAVLLNRVTCKYADSDLSEMWSTGNTVTVNAQDYEKAVIERIKEMLPKHLMLKHITKRYGSALVFYGDDKFIHVLADPRPWEDEYTIEIEAD